MSRFESNTDEELAKVLAIIIIGDNGGIRLTSLEIRGLASMTPRKTASVVAQLAADKKIRFDIETGGFVPVEVQS